ncbi:MAG: S41 family peptidase [Gemmatimonadaceae bacterium]
MPEDKSGELLMVRRTGVGRILWLIVAWLCVASGAQAQSKRTADSVLRYMDEALDTLRRVALRRDSVDWPALKDSLFARTSGAQTTRETWPALQWALRRVDRHSFLQTPEPVAAAAPKPNEIAPPRQRPPAVAGRLIDGHVGYVLVPWFPGRNRPSFVDSLQGLIREYDSAGACGWVVDLRLNQGGNMWPMLAGIGPLLGDSIFGSFVVSGQSDQPWRYLRGHAWSGDDSVPNWAARGTQPAYVMRARYPPVALLLGRETASSGEATAIAFLGRPNVRSFGDSTAGFASTNNGYKLRDGANMVITIGYSKDRSGRQYGLRLTPDELVQPATDSAKDAALDRAVVWLRSQPSCGRRR